VGEHVPDGEMALGNLRNPVRICWRIPDVPGAVLFHARYSNDFIPHSHEAATILIVTEGFVDIGVEHRRYRAQQGQMVIVGAGQIHSAHLVGFNGWKMRTLHLPTSQMRNILGGELSQLHFSKPVQTVSPIVSTFLDLHCCTERLNASCGDLRGFIKDLYREIDIFGPKNSSESETDQRMVRAKNIILELFAENMEMNDIASELGFSPFSFTRRFAKAFGLSPCAWRMQVRANEAAKLLRERKSAAEAAILSGFSDQPHMARTFKKVFGITPGQYCTMHMNKPRGDASRLAYHSGSGGCSFV